MIVLTRFHTGERFAVNPDLIERIEETPDTVVTLTNGTKHVVQQSIDEIAESVQILKATTLSLAARMADDPSVGPSAHLRLVHDATDVRELGPPPDPPAPPEP